MANDGDKQDPTAETPSETAETGAAATAEDVAATAKAEELAKLAAEAKAPSQEPEPPDLGVEAREDKPAVAPSASATRVQPADPASMLEIKPNSEGLFGTDVIDKEAGDRYTPDRPYLTERRNRPAIIALIIAVLLIIGGIVYLMTDEDASTRVKWFLAGTNCAMDQKTMEPVLPVPPEPPGNLNCLQIYVEQARRAAEARWKAEDFRSRHIYGDVTLTYFPNDARVDVFEAKFVQEGKAWTRNEAGPGDIVCDGLFVETAPDAMMTTALKSQKRCERQLKNKTAELKENEFLNDLPLKNLPIFETDKCTDQWETWNAESQNCKGGDGFYKLGAVINAYTYEYRIVLSREGYEPREFVWRKSDWRRGSPNYTMDWPGADLIPKPETQMKNYAQAECALFCYQVMKEIPYKDIPPDTLERILQRNGFKDEEVFKKAHEVLTRGDFTPWWQAKEKTIMELKRKDCEDEERNVCAEIAAPAPEEAPQPE
ncbi:MAG: hypothetical protein EP329_18780 [Deltaproteobacteria bacterium]|nr:MAG: hypothetical protein EP329_18780 [Deltaproteobacteria bacterium]